MAARKKICYSWALWTKAAAVRQMRFLVVRFSRLDPDIVNCAVVTAPFVSKKFAGGSWHHILTWHDVRLKADGTAYSKDGKPLKEYNLNFDAYGAAE